MENYRSSAHIIDAANALIAHNGERMKQDKPIRIDRGRAREPAGGRWTALDGHARGRVLLRRVPDAARQAAAVVERLRTLHRLGGHAWRDFAVLARTHGVLALIRALCEHADIPVRLGGDSLPLHRIREVHAFLRALRERGHEPLTPAQLETMFPAPSPARLNPWRDLLEELIQAWRAELEVEAEGPQEDKPALAVSAGQIAEFCWEGLAEQRREHGQQGGDAVLLASLHGAKGLEFPHVLIADGGWSAGSSTSA